MPEAKNAGPGKDTTDLDVSLVNLTEVANHTIASIGKDSTADRTELLLTYFIGLARRHMDREKQTGALPVETAGRRDRIDGILKAIESALRASPQDHEGMRRLMRQWAIEQLGSEVHLCQPHYDCDAANAERRTICRAFTHWMELKGDRPMPSVAEIATMERIGDLAPYLFLIETERDGSAHVFRSFGSAIGELFGAINPGNPVAAKALPHPLSENLQHLVENVTNYGLPISNSGNCTKPVEGKEILYRSMLFPLGSDGSSVDHVLGVIGFRTVTA